MLVQKRVMSNTLHIYVFIDTTYVISEHLQDIVLLLYEYKTSFSQEIHGCTQIDGLLCA